MVATDACSCATCDSSAIVTLSRKRRCTRVLTVRRNQVAAAETPSARAAASTLTRFCWRTPSPSSFSQTATNESGSADSREIRNAAINNPGSWRYPSLHRRHIEGKAEGSAGGCLREDIIRHTLLVFSSGESLG